MIRLKKENERIDEIDSHITKMTHELNNLRRGQNKVNHLVLEKRLGRYMEENPISEKGVSLRKKNIKKHIGLYLCGRIIRIYHIRRK